MTKSLLEVRETEFKADFQVIYLIENLEKGKGDTLDGSRRGGQYNSELTVFEVPTALPNAHWPRGPGSLVLRETEVWMAAAS